MKNHRLLTRTSILGASLLMAATFLPLSACAKTKTSSDSSSDSSSESASGSSSSHKAKHEKKTKTEKTTHEKSKHQKKSHEKATTESTTPVASTVADQKSNEILHQVSDYYMGLKKWQTRLIQKLVASSDTKTVELLSVVDVGVKKPNFIALNLRAGMPGGSMYSDGTNAYFYSQILNKYNVKPAPTDLEKLFGDVSSRYVNGPYAMYSLLPSLVSKDPYDSIMAGVKKADYVGIEDVDSTSCHHIRFTQDKFVWDLWVDAGKNPWVVKVSPDLFADIASATPKALGRLVPKSTKMSLTFRYKDWVANPSLKEKYFKFVPPPESTEAKSFAPEPGEEKLEKVEVSPLVGTDAPKFKLQLTDGKELNLAKFKDKDIVVIDFWASWCSPCRESLPIVTRVTKSFAGKHVVFYPINVGEELDVVKAYLTKANLDVVAALDSDKAVSKLFGVTGIPQTVIIDKNGIIKILDIGYSSDMEKRLTADLDSLVKGKTAK